MLFLLTGFPQSMPSCSLGTFVRRPVAIGVAYNEIGEIRCKKSASSSAARDFSHLLDCSFRWSWRQSRHVQSARLMVEAGGFSTDKESQHFLRMGCRFGLHFTGLRFFFTSLGCGYFYLVCEIPHSFCCPYSSSSKQSKHDPLWASLITTRLSLRKRTCPLRNSSSTGTRTLTEPYRHTFRERQAATAGFC
jgi:hypothetical protein